jgi:cell wall-associated NlpC family hydrolase
MRMPRRRLKDRVRWADHTPMGPVGSGLRRRLMALVAITASAVVVVSGPAALAGNGEVDLTAGERGSGAPAFPTVLPRRAASGPSLRWSDIGRAYRWVRPAANWVGEANDWMRDYRANSDGAYPFRPGRLEPRRLFARAIVRALAPGEAEDPTITFTDVDPESRFHRFANVAVKLGWMTRGQSGAFHPDEPVTTTTVHRAFVRALGLKDTAEEIDGLHTRNGFRFDTPRHVGVLMLGMRLGLRYNNWANESQDVGPRTTLNRAQVAYSLYKATTLQSWVVPYLADQYAGFELPGMTQKRREIVQWGLRYVGYPYVWGGEWGLPSPEPSALGGQPVPGFDCSGLTWWVTRRNDGGAWQVAPPRPYEGWRLPQRTSRDMAAMAPRRIHYRDLKPGDLMFYDGNGDNVVDHVDVFIGNGWAIDSSSSVGGVSFMWVGTDWYRDHFKWGRRIIRD